MIEILLLGGAIFGLFYLYRADFSHYSIFTVGVHKRLHRYKARNTDTECYASMCDRTVVEGEIRKACKEIVVFGCPVLRYDTATNYYCDSHGSFEYQQGNYSVTSTERLATTITSGIMACAAFKGGFEDTEDSAFKDVQTSMGDGLGLAPVALLVLMTAIIIAPIAKLQESTV